MTRGIQFMKSVPATGRGITELEEKGGQQAVDIPLGGVLEVKIVISDQGSCPVSYILDVFDDGRAY